MKTSLLSCLSFLILLGCSSAPLSETQLSVINNIAVVSFLDDAMPVTLLGTTVFQNEKLDVKVPKWKVNQTFKDAMIKQIRAQKRTYKEVAFDLNKAEKARKSGDTAKNRLLNQDETKMNDYLLTTAKNKGADYLWIIRPSSHPYYPEETGYGLFCRAPTGSAGEWHSYLSFHAALWDVHSHKKLYQGAVNPEVMKTLSGKVCREAKKYRPEVFAEMFRPAILKMLQESAVLFNQWSRLSPKN